MGSILLQSSLAQILRASMILSVDLGLAKMHIVGGLCLDCISPSYMP